jgi:hypothetical protein
MAGEDRHAEVDQLRPTVSPGPAEAAELGGGGAEADLETFDFAESAVATCFADALAEVVDDLDEPAARAWVDLEDGSADVPSTELAWALYEVNS